MTQNNFTKAGQIVKCFEHRTNTDSDRRTLAQRITDFANENDCIINSIDLVQNSNPRLAYVLMTKRTVGICAECQGECSPSDYLCLKCRT